MRLTAAGKTLTRPLVVVKDPRLPASVTDEDLVRQHDFARDIQAERVRVAVALKEANDLRALVAARRKESPVAAAALESLAKAIDRAAGPPLAPGEEFWDTAEIDLTTLRRLGTSLAGLQSAVESADAAPTEDAWTGFAVRRKMAVAGLARWQDVLASEKPKADEALKQAGLVPLEAPVR